ncbi:hypothetical protein D3C86_1557640 [compost metagenome]
MGHTPNGSFRWNDSDGFLHTYQKEHLPRFSLLFSSLYQFNFPIPGRTGFLVKIKKAMDNSIAFSLNIHRPEESDQIIIYLAKETDLVSLITVTLI